MAKILKFTTSNMSAMENKTVVIRNKIKELKEINYKLIKMNDNFKKVFKRNNPEAQKLRRMVHNYKVDQKTN